MKARLAIYLEAERLHGDKDRQGLQTPIANFRYSLVQDELQPPASFVNDSKPPKCSSPRPTARRSTSTSSNLYVVKACQSLTSRGYVKTQFSWQYYYYTLTPEGLDYLREWLHLPAEIVPATHIKQQRSHAPPRGMMGGEGDRQERKPFGGRGGRGGREGGDREGGYRRRDAGEGGKEGGAPGEFAPSFRGGFGRGRGGAAPAS
ncbi:hypothetical protein V490_08807 [Pseudogymnoascus sp. VKM F-3557]|nr:hypothetical protein V490_08807 [Pseudogymnoascus sp. VKM F-3557]